MPTVLLTGSEGFTGAYVAGALLARGYELVGLSHKSVDHNRYRVLVADLRDQRSVADALAGMQVDAVIHLAAIPFVAHDDVDEMYGVNIAGTRNLLASLTALPSLPKSVVLASSANIYGNAEDYPISEETPPAPANDYAVSKLAMEYMAGLWSAQLPITVVRPFNYTGVGQSPQFLIPKIVDHFKRKASVIELGNLDVARDFQDVRSVAECYCRLLELDEASAGLRTVNFCSGTTTSLAEVVTMMAEISGHRLEVRVNPTFVRANEVKMLGGTNQRLRSLLGEVPSVPFIDTLRWMYEA